MKVRLVYALPEVQHELEIELEDGSLVADAIAVAEGDPLFSRLPLRDSGWGIWGEVVDAQRALSADDRLEFYRPLRMDPMTARRQRATNRQKPPNQTQTPDQAPDQE